MNVSHREPGKVGWLRLSGAVILLIFLPAAFARWAAKHAFQTELLTNQQLREKRPAGEMTDADWTAALRRARRPHASFGPPSLLPGIIAMWLTFLSLLLRPAQ